LFMVMSLRLFLFFSPSSKKKKNTEMEKRKMVLPFSILKSLVIDLSRVSKTDLKRKSFIKVLSNDWQTIAAKTARGKELKVEGWGRLCDKFSRVQTRFDFNKNVYASMEGKWRNLVEMVIEPGVTFWGYWYSRVKPKQEKSHW
jgi:hypothetical protein